VTPQTYVLHTVAEAASLKRIPYYLRKHHQDTRAWVSEPGICQGSILQIFPHLVSSLICMWQQAIYKTNGKWIEFGVKVGLIICTFQLIVQPALTSLQQISRITRSPTSRKTRGKLATKKGSLNSESYDTPPLLRASEFKQGFACFSQTVDSFDTRRVESFGSGWQTSRLQKQRICLFFLPAASFDTRRVKSYGAGWQTSRLQKQRICLFLLPAVSFDTRRVESYGAGWQTSRLQK